MPPEILELLDILENKLSSLRKIPKRRWKYEEKRILEILYKLRREIEKLL